MGTLAELEHLATPARADDRRRQEIATRLAAWRSRRSVAPRHLRAPGPDALQLELLLEAAANAPDHRRLRPCRLVVLDPEARLRLGQAFRDYRRRVQGSLSAADAQLEAERATAAPCLVAIAARVREDLPEVPPHEQWIAVGAVVGNLMAAANALGFAGKVLSGERVRDPAVRAVVCDRDDECLVAFASLGST